MKHGEIVTCENCGVKFEARSSNAKYCSYRCSGQKYYERKLKKQKEHKSKECPNNRWVVCDNQCNCAHCGWNPEVAQRRSEKLFGKECTT